MNALYRHQLPQLSERLFLADGGLETTLVFHRGLALPHFAAFDLLKDATGTEILRDYFRGYARLAATRGLGLVLESATWRANADWAEKLGYDAQALAAANRASISLLEELREAAGREAPPLVISGNVGPRGDGYRAVGRMTPREAQAYHMPQIETFAETAADLASAFTLNYIDEAIGVVRAARDADMPVVISFTVETDGRLPSGESLADAIRKTDDYTAGYPLYYGINCAHPLHFADVLASAGEWRDRLRLLRCNASQRSHAELDASSDLEIGNPNDLARKCRDLRHVMPHLTVLGGCCGTDERHIAAIADACLAG